MFRKPQMRFSAFLDVEKYFNERTESILPSLYLLKRGFAGLRSAEQSALYFNAPDLSGQSAIVDGKELELQEIGELLERELKEITSEIDESTWYHSDFRLPEGQQIYDEPCESSAGYSFITDTRNSWNHHPSLVQHILQTPDLQRQYAYITPNKSVTWIPTAVALVLQRILDLQKKILCNIILSYGEPARGTELASHLLTNIAGGSIRSFFVLFNMPSLRASFNKTTSSQNSGKTICRFPLPELAGQFVRFLVYLWPLYLEWRTYLHPT